jgi:hypothetical protein
MDSTVLPGLPATVGYLDLKKHDLEEIAVLLLEKLAIPLGDLGEEVARAKWEGDMVPYNGTMMASFWPPIIQRAQEHSAYVITRPLARVPFGKEEGLQWTPKQACRDCGALPGQYHVRNCDFESCPACGLQALTCPCASTYLTNDEYEAWLKERCIEGENELLPWKRRNPVKKRYVAGAPARQRAIRNKKPSARKKARAERGTS